MLPKRILIVSGDFVLTGGMDRANYALADYLARQGVEVELVAHRISPDLAKYPNIRHHPVPKPVNSYFLGSRLLDREGRKRAVAVKQAGGRTIVNGGNCFVSDINWVHYVHAAYKPEFKSLARRIKQFIERPLALRAERNALSAAKVIIANSNQTRTTLIDRLSLAPERIKTVYYGIDADRFRPATPTERIELRKQLGWDDLPRVIFMGALGDRRKGFDTLAAAWEKLSHNSEWDAKLVVVGSGAEQAHWQRRFAPGGRTGSVEFLGFRSDVPELLRAAACLVAPTRYEAYGLGVHEALCCGLPAFVSAHAGVAERYRENFSDLLIQDSDDPKEIVELLSRWNADRDEFSRRVAPFAASLGCSSWADMAGQFLDLVC